MPEGPEVEALVRSLQRKWPKQARILSQTYSGKMGRLSASIKDAIVKPPLRCGKVILLPLQPTTGSPKICAIRLGMTGFCVLGPRPLDKHCHLQWRLYQNTWLTFSDPRRFGSFKLYNASQFSDFFGASGGSVLLGVGPDPMADLPWIDPGPRRGQVLYGMLQCRGAKSTLKATLMDGTFIAGIGNIYASEICFQAGVHPSRLCNSITRPEANLLAKAINEILITATLSGGSRIHSWAGTNDNSGYAKYLQVYGLNNQSCKKCGARIKKMVDHGRSTYYCSKCQR